jgi:8-oxo-dGTP diphosphatase
VTELINTELINVVGGAVLDSLAEPARLLVARRTAPPQFAGMWEFPGGKVEAGEAPEAALHRELREELGIDVVLGAELEAPEGSGWLLNERASMRVWFAEIADGDPWPLEDHDELRWVSIQDRDEALRLPWIPADLPIVRSLLTALGAPMPADSGRRT